MTPFLRIAENNNLIRDPYSKAILNTDLSAIKRHEHKINSLQKEQERSDEINIIKKEISELKEMISQLLRK